MRQAPSNTTLMGVMRGVADYYEIEVSDAWLYGASGHAFMINIHEELCPSGPYCWRREFFEALVRNLGIEMIDLGFFSGDSPATARREVENCIKAEMEAGKPCSLMNLENQLIRGVDETGFVVTQPWAPHSDFPPGHLTFGSWSEFGDSVHVNFYTFERCEPASSEKTVVDALTFAHDVLQSPGRYTDGLYSAGLAAYDTWINAVEKGHSGSHGCWWNGTVWGECRRRAAAFIREIAEAYGDVAQIATETAGRYDSVADFLEEASDKELDEKSKVAALTQAKEEERLGGAGLAVMIGEMQGVGV